MSQVSKLIVLSGLPGVGKTTVAKAVSKDFGFVYLRVDSIETPFAAKMKVEGEGYEALANIAHENLLIGNSVLVDLVNPLHITRAVFHKIATETETEIFQFECLLPDLDEHRRRVEGRTSTDQHDPNWEEVKNRNYVPWDEEQDGQRIVIDMTNKETAIEKIMEVVR